MWPKVRLHMYVKQATRVPDGVDIAPPRQLHSEQTFDFSAAQCVESVPGKLASRSERGFSVQPYCDARSFDVNGPYTTAK